MNMDFIYKAVQTGFHKKRLWAILGPVTKATLAELSLW